MSNIILGGGPSGGGSVTLLAPNTNSNQIASIPDRTGNLMMDGPAFSAYKAGVPQTITSATFTKITYNTELFDTNSNFTSSTFTPTVAGYYQLNTGASAFGGSAATRMLITFYKNGSSLYTVYDVSNSAPGRGSGSVLVYANGTTDYFEVYGYLTTGSGLAFESDYGGAGYQTWFSGNFVRAA